MRRRRTPPNRFCQPHLHRRFSPRFPRNPPPDASRSNFSRSVHARSGVWSSARCSVARNPLRAKLRAHPQGALPSARHGRGERRPVWARASTTGRRSLVGACAWPGCELLCNGSDRLTAGAHLPGRGRRRSSAGWRRADRRCRRRGTCRIGRRASLRSLSPAGCVASL